MARLYFQYYIMHFILYLNPIYAINEICQGKKKTSALNNSISDKVLLTFIHKFMLFVLYY
jgi:hypothetical protein